MKKPITLTTNFVSNLSPVFCPNGKFIATIEENNQENNQKNQTVILWDIIRGIKLAELNKDVELPGISQVLFSPDSQLVTTATYLTGTVTLWKIPSGEKVHDLIRGNLVAFAAKGKLLITADQPVFEPEDTFKKSCIRIWDLDGKEIDQLEGYDHYIYNLQVSPDGKYLAALDCHYNQETGFLRLWDISCYWS
ncbi:WD40 repeat domain-containing protein [Gloeothece verrucosa]|uniref:WD40 repeat domain-containing protein n=1 Tax=Gloeothece verrucosa TaxID=2546359 RepID=UPI00017E2F9D|nr:hypothetical protein [Gloeothece verrucosa]